MRTELFESMPVPKAIMKLCIPTILSSLVLIVYNLADTFFVGLLNDPAQTAGITLISPLTLGFIAITNLFGVGSSSLMSRALGAKDYELVKKSSAFGFYCSLFAAALISIVISLLRSPVLKLLGTDQTTAPAASGYMFWTVMLGAIPSILNIVMAYMVRSEGASLHASIGTMSGCVLNIIIDPIFILPWGLNMGSAGAGCATFISNCVACIYFIILITAKRNRTYVCLDIRKFSFNKEIIKNVFSVGIPAMIQNLLNVTSMTILNNFTAGFGEQAVAAMGIASKLQMIPINLNVGMTQGSMPIFGYNYASGDNKRLKKSVIFSIALTVGVIAVICLAFMIFSGDLIRAFMDNDVVVGYGSWFLTAMCIAMPFMCIDYSAVGVFQGCGMGGRAFIFAILRKVVLEIPALLILSRLIPLYGLPFSSCIAEVVMAIVACVMLIRMFRKLSGSDVKA
ncbi:MAG: MATE family efflux transporter [Lachnospiraceae bacterium]|nr:MATE family efflux transporter [Lachnospiraceae bacterium]